MNVNVGNIGISGSQKDISKGVVFVQGESNPCPHFARILRRGLGDIEVADSLSGVSELSSRRLITVNFDGLTSREKDSLINTFRGGGGKATLLLLSENTAREHLVQLFGAHALTNMLVVHNKSVDTCDFLVTIRKILQRDIFGLEKYFVWGTSQTRLRLTASSDRGRVLEGIADYCNSIGIPRRLAGLVGSVADEFVTNAIYNAPVDSEGSARFANLPRTRAVHLDPGEEVEIRFCCDGWRFGVAALDPFGSLTSEIVLDYLAKCFRKEAYAAGSDAGGAGLGFYHIFESLSHFVVNIDPGRKTEMIGLLDVSGSYRSFVESGKSFNLFVGE